jgi:hypothetical integral membrane protein (TIGR02206 family)
VTAPARFVPFGADHLVALAVTVVAAVGACLVVRLAPEGPWGRAVRYGLAVLLLGGVAGYLGAEATTGRLSPWDFAPLHLCDLAIFIGAYALLTRGQLACEVLYFWAGAGTLLAMVTPEVWYGFPDWRFLAYFGLHGAVVVAAATLTLGFGRRPRSGAAWRVFLLTVAYAGVVGLVNGLFSVNYLYLRHKPLTPTLLDHFGPWPYYILVAAGLGFGLFLLLDLPFRLARSSRGARAAQ